MKTILDTIVARKREELVQRQVVRSLAAIQSLAAASTAPRGFAQALARAAAERPAIISEIKRGSPSLGCIRPDLDASGQALNYERGGASALSVLTDIDFFFGSDEDFRSVRESVTLPMLRKDFIIDEYQVYESRALGADCILLIMAILSDEQASALADLVHELGMTVLAETHSVAEIQRAVDHVDYDLIGINNRNLKTFETSEKVTLELAEMVPDRDKLVAESGLHSPDAIRRLWHQDIRRFLIGEAFVRAEDPEATVRSFVEMK
jgi:indole-3-glycerol phosphate synthase